MEAIIEHWPGLAAFVILVGLREVLAKLLSDAEKYRMPTDEKKLSLMSINSAADTMRSVMLYRKPLGGWRGKVYTLLPLVPPAAGFVFGLLDGIPVPSVVQHMTTHGHNVTLAPALYYGAVGGLSTWFASNQVVRRMLKFKTQ